MPFFFVEDPVGLPGGVVGCPVWWVVVPVGAEKSLDLRGSVEQCLVEVVRHSYVVGVHGPGAHCNFPV